jgi:amphi-Trp domain-containing protein
MSSEIETDVSRRRFAATLRRIADALEAGRPFRLQVAGQRVHVPSGATPSLVVETADGERELELQLRWAVANEAPAPESD